jgi:hypothetical protein
MVSVVSTPAAGTTVVIMAEAAAGEAVAARVADAAVVEARVADAADRGGSCFGRCGNHILEGRADALPFLLQIGKKIYEMSPNQKRHRPCFADRVEDQRPPPLLN